LAHVLTESVRWVAEDNQVNCRHRERMSVNGDKESRNVTLSLWQQLNSEDKLGVCASSSAVCEHEVRYTVRVVMCLLACHLCSNAASTAYEKFRGWLLAE
jgi:hypothetical protein